MTLVFCIVFDADIWLLCKHWATLQEFARLHLESHKKQFVKTMDADYCT